MAYKKQLRDKNGNVVYPDVGLNLDDVVYSDDPTEEFDSIIDPNSYSLSEKWTGGYWVDGKKIYKKTIYLGALPNNTTKTVSHGITNLDYIIDFVSVAYNPKSNSNTGAWQKVPMVRTDNNPVAMVFRRTEVSIQTGADVSGYTKTYVTVYYTKTTS